MNRLAAAGFIAGAAGVVSLGALLRGHWHWALTWTTLAVLALLVGHALALQARLDRLTILTGAWRTARPLNGDECAQTIDQREQPVSADGDPEATPVEAADEGDEFRGLDALPAVGSAKFNARDYS